MFQNPYNKVMQSKLKAQKRPLQIDAKIKVKIKKIEFSLSAVCEMLSWRAMRDEEGCEVWKECTEKSRREEATVKQSVE
jgi:hypothetical protein